VTRENEIPLGSTGRIPFSRATPGGLLVRRLLPAAIVVPLLAGPLVLFGFSEWQIGVVSAVAIVAGVRIIAATGLVLWTAGTLDRADEKRRSAEEALRRSESHHRALARSFPDGAVILFDRELRHLIADGVGLEAVGLSAEAMEGKTIHEVFPPAVCADLEPHYRAALDGREGRFEYAYRGRAYDVRVVPVSDEGTGRVWGGAVTAVDITARKRSEREASEATERFARIFENAPIGAAIATPEGRFLRVNRALCEALGYREDELLALGFLDITHPDDRALSAAAAGRAVDGQVRSYHLDKRYVHARGHTVWARISASLVRGDADEPAYFVTQIEDVTGRLEAEARMHRAEESYRTLVEQLPLAMYIRPLDMGSANLYCSPRVAELLGYTAEEWETDPGILERTVHPDDIAYVVACGERVRRTGEPFRGEYRYIHRDGHVVWVQDETYRLVDEHGTPTAVQGFLLDITERKHAEDERDRLRDQLHHAQKIEAIGQLAGGVAHEFNNTLTAITAYSSLVLEQLEPGSPLRRDVEGVLGSAERAVSLTRQLLAFGRKQVLQPRAVDLNEVVETSIDLMRPLVDPAVRLTAVLDTTLPVTEADPTQVEQVIVNLVLNARDAITDGGAITVATGRVALDGALAAEHDVAPGDYLAVRVTDNGRGMDAATQARMFEPFFTTKAEGKGTGLGLSTAYGIVRQGGGFVSVDSAPGEGTTVAFHLPCHPAPRKSAPSAGPSAPVQLGEDAGTALVVDDEPSVRDVCAAVLERIGYRVRTASDGRAALELLERRGPVDLLLTDVVMPRLSGIELGRRVAELHPDTVVVHMSGFPGDLTGAADGMLFLQKPFTAADLEELLPAPRAAGDDVGLDTLEREVLRLLAEGETSDDVGRRLSLPPAAVEAHVRSAMGKLHAETRAHAVATALRRSLIS
jgi:PAS domain S-box-containing protein